MEIQKRIIYTITSCLPEIYIEWHQLLFSDGLTEAVNADGVEFGIERLQDLFRLSCINGESARNAINLMLEEVGSYEAEQGDDQTLIIIQHM